MQVNEPQFAIILFVTTILSWICNKICGRRSGELEILASIRSPGGIQLFQKMLSGRTTNVNCRTTIARLKENVDIEY